MCKRYKITLTEEQMRIVEKCTEFYFRLMLGQPRDLADELAFYGADLSPENPNHDKIFDRCIIKRDMIYDTLNGIYRGVFNNGYGVPEEKSEDMMMAECIWDAVRFARGKSNWSSPLHIGKEPTPKIEVVEE